MRRFGDRDNNWNNLDWLLLSDVTKQLCEEWGKNCHVVKLSTLKNRNRLVLSLTKIGFEKTHKQVSQHTGPCGVSKSNLSLTPSLVRCFLPVWIRASPPSLTRWTPRPPPISIWVPRSKPSKGPWDGRNYRVSSWFLLAVISSFTNSIFPCIQVYSTSEEGSPKHLSSAPT